VIVPGLRNGAEVVDGMAYFGRMLDKIRLHAAGKLPADYNRGTGFDTRCVKFLGVEYAALEQRTIQGGSDGEILAWAKAAGRSPTPEDVELWNAWITKRGWRDDRSESLAKMKADRGWANRDEIQTYLDFHRADESAP
jgi:gluconokinase